MKIYSLLLYFIFSASFLFAQDCSKLRIGTFYYYPARSYISPADYSIITMRDSFRVEVMPFNNDTLLWKVRIENDCIFKFKLIRRTGFVSEATKRLLNDSTYYRMEILQVTKDYYTFLGHWETQEQRNTFIDTVWMKPKF